MAKHRAPAQIEIATTTEKTWLHEAVDRYWKLVALAAVVFTIGVLYTQKMAEDGRAELEEGWDRLSAELSFSSAMLFGSGSFTAPSPSVLSLLSEDLGHTPAASWAKAIEIGKYVEDENYANAERVLDELSLEWPDHPLATQRLYPGSDGKLETLADHIRSRREGMTAWENDHPLLFSNPPPPDDAPRVRIQTEKGPFVVALYSDRAPQHSENFLELCKQNYYDGTRFHRVLPNKMIQGGDPNTIDGEPETWGLGGPEKTIESEVDPALKHFAGYLAAAKKTGAANSSGSQFYITTEPNHAWDGTYTVYGKVIEGFAVIGEIAGAPVTGDKPQTPVVLQSTEIL